MLKPTTTPGRAPQDPPIRDTGVDRASVNTSLEPAGLQDTPITQQPITQHSINRDTSEEDAVGIAPPGGADFVVRVAGYNDAFVDRPYSLRVRVTDPFVEPVCTPRTNMPHALAGAPTAVPAGANTLFVVDPTRLEATYPGQSASVMSALTAVATGPAALGVKGYLLQVDRYQDVQDAYAAWDGNPCSVSKANAVAAADLGEDRRAQVGEPDDQVRRHGRRLRPGARLRRAGPDADRQRDRLRLDVRAATSTSAVQTGQRATDDPYYDTDPVPIDDGQFFVGDLIGGRLVETPAQIAGQIDRYRPPRQRAARALDAPSPTATTSRRTARRRSVTASFDSSLGAGERRAADQRQLDGRAAAGQPEGSSRRPVRRRSTC